VIHLTIRINHAPQVVLFLCIIELRNACSQWLMYTTLEVHIGFP